MSMADFRGPLRSLAEALPAGTAVPVPREWLLELLDSGALLPERTGVAAADLTVEEVAQRFGRNASTVRGWVTQGIMPGAYRLRGREWRVPVASLRAFEDAERRGGTRAALRSTTGATADLSAWRKVRERGER